MVALRTAILALALVISMANAQTDKSQHTAYTVGPEADRWIDHFKDQNLIVQTDRRESPVTRTDRIPIDWIGRSGPPSFTGKAQPDEFYVFQVSILNKGLQPATISSVSVDMGGKASQQVCLNTAVSQEAGHRITIPSRKIQTLWIGAEFKDPGTYRGSVSAQVALGDSGSFEEVVVPVTIQVDGPRVANHGVDESWRLSRLKWLLPTDLGNGDMPTKGYRGVVRKGHSITLTATKITLAENGLPAQITSTLTPSKQLLSQPVSFDLITDHGPVIWSQPKIQFEPSRQDGARWSSTSSSSVADTRCDGSVEFDGFAHFRIAVTANQTITLKDAQLRAIYRQETSRYQLGLGYRGGATPESTDWKWNVAYQQDCVWLGDVSVGAQWRFKGANYVRPLVNIYYGYRPLNLPDSWGNQGRGGVQITKPVDGRRTLRAYSGEIKILKGETLEFNFDLQITPSRPLNTDAQWATRYYHPGDIDPATPLSSVVDSALKDGANVVNVHHRKQVNPFINYPFNDFSVPDLKEFVNHTHSLGALVKLYYTTRELTWQLPEIWALKSFGDSVISSGPGAGARTVINPNGPNPMLTEALEGNFIPAWATTLDGKYAGKEDLAVITRPDSAWTDFYLQGLEWLVKNVGIDGTYIDDTALDRKNLQRARRILEAGRPNSMIDLHSWNHEDPLAARGSSTSIYMDLFPYFDRIWLGEGFDYHSATPDYWLVSMSGIPYGVMSEMLQGGGNVWRGMLFGETCRLGWSGDPRSMWKFWDDFGMKGTEMIGWWDERCPVRSDSKDILATVYRKPGQTLIAVANWSDKSITTSLKVNWKALGIDPDHMKVSVPAIAGFQSATDPTSLRAVPISAAKGLLIVVSQSAPHH